MVGNVVSGVYVTVTVLDAVTDEEGWTLGSIAVESTPGVPHTAIMSLLRGAADALELELGGPDG